MEGLTSMNKLFVAIVFMLSLVGCGGGTTADSGSTQGTVGPAGSVGPQGPQGIQGPKGDQGAQGIAGKDGLQGQPGAPGTDGRDGAPGVAGGIGPQGAQGPAGPAGAQGPAGIAAALNPANLYEVTAVGSSSTASPQAFCTGANDFPISGRCGGAFNGQFGMKQDAVTKKWGWYCYGLVVGTSAGPPQAWVTCLKQP
jgi:hypothetical protein